MQISAKTRKPFLWAVRFQVSDDECLALVREVAIDAKDWDEYKAAVAESVAAVEVELEMNGGHADVLQYYGYSVCPDGIQWYSKQIDGRSDPQLLDHLRAVGFEILVPRAALSSV